MNSDVERVLAGQARCGLEAAEAREWLSTLPPKSLDLVIGSPPYVTKGGRYKDLPNARTMDCGEWVAFMLGVTEWAVSRCKGDVLWVVNGAVEDGQYLPAVEGLVWKWHEMGRRLERPVIWHKNAPPSRRDWFGNDYEFVLCFPSERRVWNWESIGTPPKYRAGGRFRQRGKDGERRMGGAYPQNPVTRPRDVLRVFYPPLVQALSAVLTYVAHSQAGPGEVLQDLRRADAHGEVQIWYATVLHRLRKAAVLRPEMHGGGGANALSDYLSSLPEGIQAEQPSQEVLFNALRFARETSPPGRSRGKREQPEEGPETCSPGDVRVVREQYGLGRSSRGREPAEQRPGEPSEALPSLPRQSPQSAAPGDAGMHCLWQNAVEEVREIWHRVRQTLPEMQKVRFSESCQEEGRFEVGGDPRSGLIRATVGGGHLGHELASLNEAPYPLKLVEPFVKALTNPDDLIADPFLGGGTSAHAALLHGRRFVGCDLRPSQVELTSRRLQSLSEPERA